MTCFSTVKNNLFIVKESLVGSNLLLSQDKQKSKVKEKMDKCNKEKLLEFCDLFDIPTAKATSKKVCRLFANCLLFVFNVFRILFFSHLIL